MNIKQMWKQFIWLDSANWTGITLVDPEILSQDILKNSDDDNDNDNIGDINNSRLSKTDNKKINDHKKNNNRDKNDGENEIEEDDDDNNNNNVDDEYIGDTDKDYKFKQSDDYDFLDEINTEVEHNFSENIIEEDQTIFDQSSETKARIDGSWDIISYLPSAAGTYLRHTIGNNSNLFNTFQFKSKFFF